VITLPLKLACALAVSWLLSSPLVVDHRSDDSTSREPSTQTQVDGPNIDFDASVHDFGQVNEGTVLKHVFTVKNTGTSPLVLTNVSTSCGCTAATLGKGEISSGGTGPIEVTFDTRGFQGTGSKTITVNSNDKRRPTSTLEIMYNIERLLGFERAFIRLATERGTDHVEQVWLTGKFVEQAKLRVAKVEGGEQQVMVKTIEARQDKKIRKGLEITLKGNKQVAGYGDITITTGLAAPAILALRFNCSVK
jgi:hypothetical protein